VNVGPGREATARRDSKEVDSGGGRLALLVVDARGLVVLADGPALDAFGVTEQGVGDPSTLVLAAFPTLIAAVDAAIQGQRSTVSVIASNRSFDVAVEPRRGGGAIVGAIDTTSRNRADEARRDRERELALIFRQVPGAVWSTNLDLVVTRAFGRVAAELKLDATSVVNTSIFDVLGRRDRDDPLVRAHFAALEGHRTSYRYNFRGRRFDMITEALRDDRRRIIGTVTAAVDVTHVVDAEERLARSQALLADAQGVAHIGSWEWDIASDLVTWTDEMYRIYGLSRDAFKATFESFIERIAPEDVERTKETLFRAVEKPCSFSYEHRIVRPDGEVRMVHTRGAVSVDVRGKPTRMLGTSWDVTEQWETSRALDRTASLLRATLEATADGVFVVDRDRKITAHNQRFIELWRLPQQLVATGDEAELLAYVVEQVEDSAGFLDTVNDLYAHPEKEAFSVVRFIDGRVYERVSRPQRVGNEVVGRVWSFRDITDRERLFRRAVFLSDAARLLSSLDVEQALSSIAHLAVPYMGESCAIDLLGEGAPRRLQAVSRDRTRAVPPELSPVVLAGRPLIYTAGVASHMAVPLIVNGVVDGAITFAAAPGRRYSASDLELAEELAARTALALEKSHLLSRAQDALRAREEFLAIAAHEIRGPVTSMHAAVQALLRHKLSEPATSRALALIEREDRRLRRFVDELLDLGLTRADVASFEIEQVSLARVVRDVLSHHEDEIVRSGCALSIELDERAIGMWNRDRLEKVVTTLLSNALKFGLGKPVEIGVKVRNGHAILKVLDHGMGIPKDAQQRIFAPFERAVSVRHYGGLGLGLYIASSIVKGLGGTISVRSELGVGSEFTVELPQGAINERPDDHVGR